MTAGFHNQSTLSPEVVFAVVYILFNLTKHIHFVRDHFLNHVLLSSYTYVFGVSFVGKVVDPASAIQKDPTTSIMVLK